MSLCYDFEKWTIISLALVAVSLTIGLIMQYAHGQITEETLSEQRTLLLQKESLLELIDYCFQHADRPNPLQDLIDKGFLSPTFKGETCLSIKQKYNELQNKIKEVETKINEQRKNLTAQFDEKMQSSARYFDCIKNQTDTQKDCYQLLNATKGR